MTSTRHKTKLPARARKLSPSEEGDALPEDTGMDNALGLAAVRDALNALSQGIGIFNGELRLSVYNDKFVQYLGLPPELAKAGPKFEDVARFVSGADTGAGNAKSAALDRLATVRKGNITQYHHTKADGTVIDIRDTLLPGGEILTTCTDVTGYRLAEGSLAESEQHVRAILANAAEGIITIDESGIIQTFNPAAARMFGYSPNEMIGGNVALLMSEADAKPDNDFTHDNYIRKYLKTGKGKILGISPREVTARRKDGSLFTIELNVSEFFLGSERRFIGTIRDITERKDAELALRENEENYRNLIEGSVQGIFIHDGDKPLFANQALVDMFGYSSIDDVLSIDSIDRLYAPEERDRLEDYRKARIHGEKAPQTYEFKGLRKDGSEIWLQRSSRLITWEGRPAIQGTMVDITDKKEAEEALQGSEANLISQVLELRDREERLEIQGRELVALAEDAALMRDELDHLNKQKDKFFSIIAHDLKSPFNALLGFSSILESRGSVMDKDQVAEYGHLVHRAAEQAYHLLEDLLDWSRLQMGRMEFEPETINLNKTLEGALFLFEPIAAAKDITLQAEHQPGLSVFADKKMVETILRNLINNAIKFTNKEGAVSLKAERAGGMVQVSVTDNGVGMAPGKLEKLFHIEEKTTTQGTEGETGTGLGLHLCKELVEKNGGEITIESALGVGSTFHFTLPGEEPEAE